MKASQYLDRRQLVRLRRGFRFAAEIGRAPNQFVTLQLGATACEPEHVGPAMRRLIKQHFGPWLRPRRGEIDHRPPVYAFVVENPPAKPHNVGVHAHGTHLHWAVFVPPERDAEFREKLPAWVQRCAGLILDHTTAIDITPVTKLDFLALYMGKAVHPSRAKQLGVRKVEFQGLVMGRRCTISESILPAAIARHRERLASSTLRLVS